MSYTVPQSLIERIEPPEALTVSEWCDKHRELSDRYAAEPGRWKTSRVPYLREIMDAFADPSVGSIVLLKCARVGGTELLNNVLAYSIDARPMPCLYVLPKETDVRDEFAGRIKALIESSAKLRGHIPGGTWATADMIGLDTLTIYGAWATSPDTLIRRTIGVIVFDEIDNCEAAAGRLGNTWKVAGERLATFGYRGKLLGVTTPTTEDATGWQEYQASDRRRFNVPCPECGGYQVLAFAMLKWPEGATADEIELDRLAELACGHCGCLIPQRRQRWMIDRGIWVPASQQVAEDLPVRKRKIVEQAASGQWRPRLAGDPPRTRRRGYWINALYSPWRTWSQIAAEFKRCKPEPEKLRVFINSWLAEPWQHAVQSPDESWLKQRVTDATYREGHVPADARVLLCTADVQQDRLYYDIRAWGPQMRSWLIEAGEVADFDALYERAFHQGNPLAHDPSASMTCYALAIDSRYRSDEVHEFAQRLGVAAVAGYETRTKPVEKSNVAPKGAKQPRWVWNLNTTLFKTKLARLMQQGLEADGGWHLHAETSQEYLDHVTAEQFVEERDKKTGRKKWRWTLKSANRPNHWLDCEVYQLALIDILEQSGELAVSAMTGDTPRYGYRGPAAKRKKTASAKKPAKKKRRVTGGWQ